MSRPHPPAARRTRRRAQWLLTGAAAACLVLAPPLPGPAGPARAESPVADFTFKRVRVPAPGTRKRITVQITPGTPPAAASAPPGATPARPGPPRRRADHGFFWRAVAAGLGVPAAERLAAARAVLDQAGANGRRPFPAAGRIEAIARRFGPAIAAAARRHRLSEALLIAVIAVESGGRADALSPRDARGLMQLIPATARRMGVRDVWNPTQNILGGARYLDHLLEMFGGDLILALAGYNAGENAVLRHGGVPAFPETRGYVPRVLDAFLQAQRLCPQAAPDPRAPCPIAGAIRPAPAPALPPPLGPRRPG